MKRLEIFSIAILFYICATSVVGMTIATDIIKQQNEDTVRTFSVKEFDRVRITGPFVVTIIGGTAFSVKASGPTPDLGLMNIGTRNSTLFVEYFPVKRSENPNIEHGVVNVKITLPILKKAEFLELTRFSIRGFDKMEDLELIASSLASGFAIINAQNLRFTVDKLSSLVVQGESERLKAFLQGKSNLKAYGLKVRSVTITVEGMSTAEVSASAALDATANGMSNITYKGIPTVRQDIDSKSSIKAETMYR